MRILLLVGAPEPRRDLDGGWERMKGASTLDLGMRRMRDIEIEVLLLEF
jgi:hypothetical protein